LWRVVITIPLKSKVDLNEQAVVTLPEPAASDEGRDGGNQKLDKAPYQVLAAALSPLRVAAGKGGSRGSW